ncbi:PepSY-like domain-containing protein [Nibrella saemangeumensis]
MKKIFFLLTALLVIWVSACRRPEVQPDTPATVVDNDFANVPAVVVQAVRKAYPAATELSFSELDKGKVWDSRFVIDAKNHQARIDVKGTILEAYTVATADARTGITLPAAAQEYIQKTYPNYKIVVAGEGQHNNQKAYKVLVRGEKEEITLVFDEEGKVLLEFKAAVSTRPAEDLPTNYPIVKPEDLPAPISQYLRENGLTFAKGMVIVDGEDKKFYHIAARKGEAIYELSFSGDGGLLRSNVYIPPVAIQSINDLPAAAAAYLNGYTLERGMAFTDREGKKMYSVVVSKDGKRYDMSFDSEGKLLRSALIPPDPQVIRSAAELPEPIKAYLKDYTFEKGMLFYDRDGKKYYEIAASKNGKVAFFVFDAEGKVVRSSESGPNPNVDQKALTAEGLPAPILAHLNATYKGWTFMKGYVVLAEGKAQSYLVVVQVEKDLLYLTFNGEGTFENVRKG